jgi:putative flippase GtrA
MMLRRLSLFASGSVIGAVIDYVATLGLSGWLKLDPAIALALAMIISASVVFRFHSRITFEEANNNLFRRYVLFMGWSALIFVLRAVLLKAALYAGLPLAAALLVAIGLASIINFAMSSAVIFAKKSS